MSTRLDIVVRNLKELERRAAMHGPGEAPLFLLSQIAELKEQIQQEAGGELESLRRRRDDARENLRLIEERKSSYVLSTDIPLSLIKEERRLRDQIEELENRVRDLEDLLASVQSFDRAEKRDPAVDDEAKAEQIPCVLQLLHPQGSAPQVLVQHSWAGDTGPQPLEPPYGAEDLILVMKALATPVGKLPVDRFDADEVTRLEDLDLVESGHLLERMYRVVGRDLYESLFPPEIERLFHAARAQAKSERRSLALRLIFDAGGATLASYPWELIYDDVPLVADGVVDLTRYIAFSGPRSALEVNLPLRVLGIASRPSGLPSLPPSDEPQAVSDGLASLAEQEALEITWLSPPTRPALLETLQQEDVHVIHFDGHGSFGRLCPVCQVLHTAASAHCVRCHYPLSTVDARGYLAFEDEEGDVNYVSARSFANALSRNKTQVVVLSACRSGQVGGGSVFNGVGPALIQAGVPAVVAMQIPATVDDAVRFARTFYTSLASFHPLVEAVGRGRQQLYDETCNPRTWFVPTLYLRSDDPRGDLFHPTQDR